MARGVFREDLYHRLNVIRIELPPLRARSEDIPELLEHYINAAAHELGVEAQDAFAGVAARSLLRMRGRATCASS